MSERFFTPGGTGTGSAGGPDTGRGGAATATRVPVELLAQDLDAGLFVVEPDGTVSFATPRALTFLGIRDPNGNGSRPGLESGNPIARSIATRIPPVNGGKAAAKREYLQVGADGDRFLAVTLSPIRSKPGSGRWVILVEDVSDVVGKGREASQWARGLVHDLKSPLSTVAGAVDLIFSGRLGEIDPKLQNFLNLVQKGVDRLIEMLGTAGKTRPTGAPEAVVVEGSPQPAGPGSFHG